MNVGCKLVTVLLIQLTLAGCASHAWGPGISSHKNFEVQIVDDPSKYRFMIQLLSKSSAPLCLHREGWPNDFGLPYSASPARLFWENGVLISKGQSLGICIGGCGRIEILPGDRLDGYIDYSAFGDREEIAKLPNRTLQFDVYPDKCPK
jgi:hypothetical protein